MAIHIAANTGCNLGCTYCYEEPDREMKEEQIEKEYDIDEIMETLGEWKERYPDTMPGMHGGEPMLVKDEHLDQIFNFITEHWDGRPHIQTNGTILSDSHVEMFKKYDVGVGISCDGPVELNTERKARIGGEDATDNMSEQVHENIERLVDEGIGCGIITVLHKTNAGTDERLEKLLEWMDWLNKNGVSGHYNPAIPYEDVQQDVSLSPERLKEVYLRTWEWIKAEPYRSWNPMQQYVDNLLGVQLGNCVNNKCDPYNAGAAKIIKGDGSTTGCGKTWDFGDGVPFLQGPSTGNEYNNDDSRYEMLKQVPGAPGDDSAPDMGGCRGCRYWNVCQGGCPGAGQNDDWRNKTIWCGAKYALYEQIEHDIRAIMPNVRLVTDLPWDAEVSDTASSWQLDIKPFAAIRPDQDGNSSSYGNATHGFGSVEEQVPDEALPDRTFEEKVERYKREYGEEVVTVDRERGEIHADSETAKWSKADNETEDGDQE